MVIPFRLSSQFPAVTSGKSGDQAGGGLAGRVCCNKGSGGKKDPPRPLVITSPTTSSNTKLPTIDSWISQKHFIPLILTFFYLNLYSWDTAEVVRELDKRLKTIT